MPKVKRAVVGVLVRDLNVLLIRRNPYLKRHGGEIGFPGGMVREGESYEGALNRELEEELGLSPSDYFVVGELSPVKTLMTDIKVYPFVALLRRPERIRPNPEEVEEYALVPLRALRPLVYEDTVRTELGVVWGATARIIRNLFREGRTFLPEIESLLPGR